MLVTELEDAPDPEHACARFLDLPLCLLLDSAARSERLGRYSFLTADPFLSIRSKDGRVETRRAGATRTEPGDPFAVLSRELARHRAPAGPGLPPFQGGAAGCFGYDLCHHLERLPFPPYDDLALPDLCIGFYDWVIAWDHQRRRAWLISSGLPEPAGRSGRRRAESRAAAVLARLASGSSRVERRPAAAAASRPPERAPTHAVPEMPGLRSTFSRDAYLCAVERTREYIRAGDIFQANLSHRLEAPAADDAWPLYLRLRRRNRAPFAAYFDAGDAQILSSSPERFVRLEDGRVETRPIKGTAPRGRTPAEDRALAAALGRSAKDRAENVMIVDLLRNDLSLVCRDGSVEVPELCALESYAEVHHLASAVTGLMRPGLGAVDLLRATFPSGSITGAPKVRAMELLAELEPTRRGVYTGAIGYIGFDGAMDTSVAIRTAVVRDGTVFLQVGGGIVVDSVPRREYQETLQKARGMVNALHPDDLAADRREDGRGAERDARGAAGS